MSSAIHQSAKNGAAANGFRNSDPSDQAVPADVSRQSVPTDRPLREKLRLAAIASAQQLDRNRLLDSADLETAAMEILAELRVADCHAGWTMVALASAYWREPMSMVAPSRRMLLLPTQLPHEAGCSHGVGKHSATQDGDVPGTAHRDRHSLNGNGHGHPAPAIAAATAALCPACSLEQLRILAEQRNYQILPVENKADVLAAILHGDIDGVMGLASLELLEKAVDSVLWFGIPCMAIPLGDVSQSDSGAPQFDADWLRELIELPLVYDAAAAPNYLSLARVAKQMFDPEELEQLAPRLRGSGSLGAPQSLDPIASTEAIAYDFLAKGGKHSRPFITLAVYDSLTGGHGSRPGAHRYLANLPPAIKRAALSIETFHKASLVHDDIEDDDPYRYGEPTVHRTFGTPVAINVGDYLIGLGYRLVSRESAVLGAEVVCDILDRLADAHMKLSEGQGAELLWRDSRRRQLTPADALQIYALKTAPAFEAALLTGLRLAGPTTDYLGPISELARCLGIAFQILNDLGDWQPDRHNKLIAAGDVIGGRPTLLWALALEGLDGERRAELERLARDVPAGEDTIRQIRRLYREANAFDKAAQLIGEYEASSRAIAAEIQPPALRRLLVYLIEIVLKRPPSIVR